MKWIFPVFFLLLFSCTENKTETAPLANGIYLLAADGQNTRFTLQSADSSQHFGIADSVPVFSEKSLNRIFRNYNGDSIEYVIGLADKDWMQMVLLQHEQAGKKLALIFNGIVAGTWTIVADTILPTPLFKTRNHIRLISLNNFCDSTDQSNKTVRYLKSDTLPGKTFYANGKTYREIRNEGSTRYTVFFYPNGDTASEFIKDNRNDSTYNCSWIPGNRRRNEVAYVSNRIVLQHEYYGNGKLKTAYSDYQTAHQSPMLEREFDFEGRLIYERKAELLKVCGQEDEFNHPQIIRVRAFRAGEPWYSGNLFSSCGYDCEMDSVDTWRFYSEGKPVSERKFVSKAARYQQYCADSSK